MATTRKRAARCLFGAPNHEEVSKQMKRDLEQIYDRDIKKFNFNFMLGVPMLATDDSDFEFEPIAADKVPAFYHDKQSVKRSVVGEKPSTSTYEKPVTRSSTQKQTKLTKFMPIRKRRSETNLIREQVENLNLNKRPSRLTLSKTAINSQSDTSSAKSPPAKMRFQRRATTRQQQQQQRQTMEAGDSLA